MTAIPQQNMTAIPQYDGYMTAIPQQKIFLILSPTI